jgi:hypothetical protein
MDDFDNRIDDLAREYDRRFGDHQGETGAPESEAKPKARRNGETSEDQIALAFVRRHGDAEKRTA